MICEDANFEDIEDKASKTIILVMHMLILMETRNEPKEWLSLHCQYIIHYWEKKPFLPWRIVKVKMRIILNYSRELGIMPSQIYELG